MKIGTWAHAHLLRSTAAAVKMADKYGCDDSRHFEFARDLITVKQGAVAKKIEKIDDVKIPKQKAYIQLLKLNSTLDSKPMKIDCGSTAFLSRSESEGGSKVIKGEIDRRIDKKAWLLVSKTTLQVKELQYETRLEQLSRGDVNFIAHASEDQLRSSVHVPVVAARDNVRLESSSRSFDGGSGRNSLVGHDTVDDFKVTTVWHGSGEAAVDWEGDEFPI